MKKQIKKGFTLVELLVVIAIIAILSVVSVVGYTSFTKKAKVSNDLSLTTQMNNILQAEETSGTKLNTPHDAIVALEEGGLDVTKLTPTTDGYIYVYNTNGKAGERIVLLDEKYNVKAPEGLVLGSTKEDYFAFVSTDKEITKYTTEGFSIYVKDSYEGTTITTSTGFDIGDNTKVLTVNYTTTAEKEVVIRTNGGTLEVNAENSTVHHYGAANYTNIKAIDTESYHENGVSAYVRIEQGHFVAENTAKVINLNVVNSTVTITEVKGAKVVDYSKASDAVEVKVNGATKTVTEVKTEAQIVSDAKNSDIVAENGVAEIDGIQYKSLQSAFDMARDGDTIILNEDLDIENEIRFNDNQEKRDINVTLDMNGKTIKNTKDIWEVADKNACSLLSIYYGNLTITGNGTFKAESDDCYAISLHYVLGTCTIENGTFVGNVHSIYVERGTLNVKGGIYSVQQKYDDENRSYEYVLNCYDYYYKVESAKIFVTGGTFDNFNPYNNYAEGENTNFCLDGYKVVSEEKDVSGVTHTYYTVVKE